MSYLFKHNISDDILALIWVDNQNEDTQICYLTGSWKSLWLRIEKIGPSIVESKHYVLPDEQETFLHFLKTVSPLGYLPTQVHEWQARSVLRDVNSTIAGGEYWVENFEI